MLSIAGYGARYLAHQLAIHVTHFRYVIQSALKDEPSPGLEVHWSGITGRFAPPSVNTIPKKVRAHSSTPYAKNGTQPA